MPQRYFRCLWIPFYSIQRIVLCWTMHTNLYRQIDKWTNRHTFTIAHRLLFVIGVTMGFWIFIYIKKCGEKLCMRLILTSRSKEITHRSLLCHASMDYNSAVNCLFWMMMMLIISTAHTHEYAHRKQLFENVWRRDDVVDRKTWFTIKHFCCCCFWYFRIHTVCNMCSLRMFFLSLSTKQKKWVKFLVIIVVSLFLLSNFLFHFIWCEH